MSDKSQGFIPADIWMPVFLEELKDGKTLRIAPHGYSMYPFLVSDRDEVFLEIPARPPKRGDIVLYRRDNGLHVLHRVHHAAEDGYYMIGDGQNVIEGPVRGDQILAVASSFVRKGKLYSCSSRAYRLLASIWLRIIPLRLPVIKAWRRLRGH